MSGSPHDGDGAKGPPAGEGAPPELSADECVRAGMYWFGRSDPAAAEAWWSRALVIDPQHARARECLRLLARSAGEVVEGKDVPDSVLAEIPTPPRATTADLPTLEPSPPDSDVPARLQAPPPPGRKDSFLSQNSDVHTMLSPGGFGPPPPLPRVVEVPTLFPDGRPITDDLPSPRRPPPQPPVRRHAFRPDLDVDAAAWALEDAAKNQDEGSGSIDLSGWDPELEEPVTAREQPAARPPVPARGEPPPRRGPIPGSGGGALVAPSRPETRESASPRPPERRGAPNPWDEGPSRTSVVNVRHDDFDAVAEPTPLPEFERERFFRRADEQEIVGRLEEGEVETVVMPTPPRPVRGPRSEDIVFADPVEFSSPPDPEATTDPAQGRLGPAEIREAAKRRFQLHDFDGVLELCAELPGEEAERPEVRTLVADARANLTRMFESKLGSLERSPKVLISGEEVIWLNMNHRAGFILSQIDGTVSYEDLIALSGMPRLDTLRILAELVTSKVIGTF